MICSSDALSRAFGGYHLVRLAPCCSAGPAEEKKQLHLSKLYRLFLSPHSLSVTTVTLGFRLFFILLQINLHLSREMTQRNGKLPLIQLDDGETYEGEWLNGKQHGHGIYTWPDGER